MLYRQRIIFDAHVQFLKNWSRMIRLIEHPTNSWLTFVPAQLERDDLFERCKQIIEEWNAKPTIINDDPTANMLYRAAVNAAKVLSEQKITTHYVAHSPTYRTDDVYGA